MKTCMQCGAEVRRKLADGSPAYNVSSWLKAVDKHELFCSMRCAARFGISAAERTMMGGNLDVRPRAR